MAMTTKTSIMKLKTSCSLHLNISHPADVSKAVSFLIGFLRNQGVHDRKFLAEFHRAATGVVTCAIERWRAGPDDQFANITLTINSIEVQFEIVASANLEKESDGAPLPEDAPVDREFLTKQMMTKMQPDADRDGTHAVVLRKSLGQFSWN
jgi:hypothetical protein